MELVWTVSKTSVLLLSCFFIFEQMFLQIIYKFENIQNLMKNTVVYISAENEAVHLSSHKYRFISNQFLARCTNMIVMVQVQLHRTSGLRMHFCVQFFH